MLDWISKAQEQGCLDSQRSTFLIFTCPPEKLNECIGKKRQIPSSTELEIKFVQEALDVPGEGRFPSL